MRHSVIETDGPSAVDCVMSVYRTVSGYRDCLVSQVSYSHMTHRRCRGVESTRGGMSAVWFRSNSSSRMTKNGSGLHLNSSQAEISIRMTISAVNCLSNGYDPVV